MKFKLLEELTEASYEEFNRLYDNILPGQLNYLNSWLDKYGFEVQLLDDYEYDDELKNAIGVFCGDIQDNASVFPIFINKDNIYKCLEEDGFENDYSEIKYAIEGTLWHEAGHGIYRYLLYEFEFDEDEETLVEDFARYREDSDLCKALQEYIDDIK